MKLRVSEIQITQMLGITSKSPIVLDQLDVDLIVLHGGQGVGKSTVARAITHALWPEKGLTAWGLVRFKLSQQGEADSESTATFVADQVEFPSRPISTDVEGLERATHWVRLHDLLPESPVNESAFTKHILQLADGGVNLEAAEEAVKKLPRETARSASSMAKNLRETKNILKAAESKQAEVIADEQRLEHLKEESKGLRQIQRRLSALESLKKWRESEDEYDKMLAKIEESFGQGFPDASMDSREQLENITNAIASIKFDIDQIKNALGEAIEKRQELAFASAPPNDADLDELDDRIRTFDQATTKLEQIQDKLDSVCESAKRAAAIFIDHQIRPDDLIPAVNELDAFGDFLRQAVALKQAKLLHETLADKLPRLSGDSIDDGGPSAEACLEAFLILSKWIDASSESAKQVNTPAIRSGLLSIVLMTLATVVLAGLAAAYGSLWSLGFVGLGAFSWILYFALQNKDAPLQKVSKEPPRENLEGLRIELPSSWNTVDCQRRRDELRAAYASRIQAKAMLPLKEVYRKAGSELNRADEELARQRHGLTKLGLNVDAIESRPDPSEALREAIRSVSREHELKAQAEFAVRKSKASVTSALDSIVEKLVGILGESARSKLPQDVAGMKYEVKKIRDRRNLWSDNESQLFQAEQKLGELNDKLVSEQATRDALLKKLNLKPDVNKRDESLRLEEYDKWLQEMTVLKELKASVEFSENSAKENDLTEIELGQSIESLDAAIDIAINAGERLKSLDNQIGGIRTAIENLSTADTTEKLLVDRDRYITNLREKRYATEYLAVVDAVISQLRQGSDARRPKVLKRADDILQTASGGLLSLTSLPGGDLVVNDTNGNRLKIGNLSDGERVQVALAVRLAFLQESKQATRCPVLIDEALANTDDERAPRIIDTILELSTRGWQVIYLTSQGDEVAKWQERIEAQRSSHPDFTWKAIDLDAERRMAVRTAIPNQAGWIPASIESPLAKETMDTYGLRLGRRDLDHWLAAGLQDPLWLADSPQEMFELAKRRAGRIQFLVKEGEDEDGLLVVARRRYQLLQSVFELFRRGRGKQVPRDAPITDVSGIGPSLAGRIFKALEKCNYEADVLLSLVDQDSGVISGLGPASKEGLYTWLEENEYLGDPDRKLSRDQVLGQLERGCDQGDQKWLVNIIRSVGVRD